MSDQPRQSDFRNSIPTADRTGKRIWVYPRKPKGRLHRARIAVSILLLSFFVFGPFLRIDGNPVLMMNVVERQFSLFGAVFWPQDFHIFMLAMLVVFVMIALFTAIYGRIWCGWLCPQTVLLEMVYRKVEYLIEGDAPEQRALNAAPWDARKIWKKSLKHAVFFGLSFFIGNWLLMFVIGSEAWWRLVTDSPLNHIGGFTAMILFTLLVYGIFARFREQACTFICPYGRFQSVLLDERSIVVSYDHRRGETRQRFRRVQPREQRIAEGIGDCVNCGLCVQVCPTGIDIRNGTQMECVNCTACIDACNGVMSKLGFPTGLIRYASEANIRTGERFRITPRIAGYTALLGGLTLILVFLLATHSNVEASVSQSGAPYQVQPSGRVSNLFMVKVVNKGRGDLPIRLELEQPHGQVSIAGGGLTAPASAISDGVAVVEVDPGLLAPGRTPVTFGVYSGDRRIQVVESTFQGP